MCASKLSPVTISGSHFVKDGKRFDIRGVVYQPHRSTESVHRDEDYDSLRDECLDDLQKDIVLFKELGINAIKVYSILPHLSHDAVLEALAAAGIYVLAGLFSRFHCISRKRPYESYNTRLVNEYMQAVDCFSKHDNVLGVVAADDLMCDAESTQAAEVIRAVIRDTKLYMVRQHQSNGQRILPIGIGDAMYAANSTDSMDYFTAGDVSEQIDFYSFAYYDKVVEPSSHWSQVIQRFDGRNIPIFVSEYGNNITRPRQFRETTSLYYRDALQVLSGGFAYDFVHGGNDYGLVTASHQKLQDFEFLKQRFQEAATTEETSTSELKETVTAQPVRFPPLSESWRASSNIPAPVLQTYEQP